MDLRELLTEHLWLVVWLLIALYSFFKKKRERAAGEPEGSRPEALEELRRMLESARGAPAERSTRALERASALIGRLEAIAALTADDRRLASLSRAVADDLLPRARSLSAELRDGEVVGAEYAVSKLERAASWLEVIVEQRSGEGAADLRAGERVAALAAAPFTEFCRVQGVPHQPRPHLTVRHRGRIERALRGDELPFSLVPVSLDARRDPRALPLVAREVGESIFFDVPGLASSMAKGLSLPEALHLPPTAREMRPAYLRASFGPFLADLFADLYATSLFGLAYAESLLHLASQPRVLRDAFRFQANERWVSSHPPLALRLDFVCDVLERLGRVSDAKRLRHRFERMTEGTDAYLFPAADGTAALLPRAVVHGAVRSMAPAIVDFHHSALEGFRLLDIPGLGYLHAEHAAVVRAMRELAEGRVPHEPPLLVVSAAAILAAEKPALAETLVELAHRAIRGDHHAVRVGAPRSKSLSLREMVRDPRALSQAVALGAALGRRPGARPPLH